MLCTPIELCLGCLCFAIFVDGLALTYGASTEAHVSEIVPTQKILRMDGSVLHDAPGMSLEEKWTFLLNMALAMCLAFLLLHACQMWWQILTPKKLTISHAKKMLIPGRPTASDKCKIGPPCKFPSMSLVEQFRMQAEKEPQRVALVAWLRERRTEITYGQLLTVITQISRQLLALGLQHGDFVALILERGVHQVVSIYSVMLCGAAWVPIDPEVPRLRFEDMLIDSSASLVLYQEGFEHIENWISCQNCKAAAIPLDASRISSNGVVVQESNGALPAVEPTDKAALFYTSGSTGKPKGVVYPHSQLNNGANTFADDFNVGRGSVGLVKSSYIWVGIEWEVFPTLIRGGRLVISSASGHKDVTYLADLICSEQVTTLFVTPKVLDLLLDVHSDGLQLRGLLDVVLSGDALAVELANRFVKMNNLSARLYNSYAATESSTVFYSVPPCGVDTQLFPNRCPVGRPQAGVSVRVLDEKRNEVKEGEEGEICFGGQLSDGYWRDPQRTAEKFIHSSQWGRLYCTGDLGRFTNGVLEVVGRLDRQVKIRGVRVEPEEVEASIRNFRQRTHSFQGVSVVASLEPAELVAFVSPEVQSTVLDEIQQHCKATLPPYFVPAYYFAVPELPLLPNGKTDLRALSEQAKMRIQDGVEVLDSLGLMKRLSKDTIVETQVIYRCYAFWMLAIVAGHWYQCGFGGSRSTCGNLSGPEVPSWIELFMRLWGGGDQTMFGFILLGALQESQLRPGEKYPKLRLGYRDFFIYGVFMLMAFPGPQMLYAILGPGMIRADAKSFWSGQAGEHRWYLMMILISRLLIYGCQRLSIPRVAQALGPLSLALFGPNEAFDICATKMPDVFRFSLGLGLSPHRFHKDSCPVFYSWIWWYVVMYVGAFHFCRPALKLLLNTIGNKFDGPLAASIAFGSYMLLGATMTAFHYPNISLNYGLADPNFQLLWLPLEFGGTLLQAVLLPLSMTKLPLDLKWWGGTTLGTYVLHFYVDFRAVSNFLLRLCPAQGFIQLLVLVTGPLLFTSVMGPLANLALLTPQLLQQIMRKAKAT